MITWPFVDHLIDYVVDCHVGHYGEEFVSKRKEKLETWSNWVTRHLVLSHSFVFRHFLTYSEEQVICLSVSLSSGFICLVLGSDNFYYVTYFKIWKAGKRRAEKDEFCGAQLLLTLEYPDVRTDLNKV